ncbi:MAG: hypothetical protein HGA67_03750 [Candidatus Yonathbacteria bacterium]|nr:hypothetical protein [Candidatus Yonathbacteria bacterium]
MNESAWFESEMEKVILDMKKGLRTFIERPVTAVFERMRVFYGEEGRSDQLFVWIDLGEISFSLFKKSELLEFFKKVSSSFGFNICLQSLDIPGGIYYVLPKNIEGYTDAKIWAARIYHNRDILFTCVLKELPFTEEELKEAPEGGSWSLWCFLIEEDERCIVRPGQMN